MIRLSLLMAFASVAILPTEALAEVSPSRAVVVTEVIEAHHISVAHLSALHQRVMGDVEASKRVMVGGKLLLTDTQARIASFRALIEGLDRRSEPGSKTFVRPVRYRSPSEIMEVLRPLIKPLRATLIMAADDRSGHLIVRAPASQYASLDRLLRRLDIPPRRQRGLYLLEGADRARTLGWTR